MTSCVQWSELQTSYHAYQIKWVFSIPGFARSGHSVSTLRPIDLNGPEWSYVIIRIITFHIHTQKHMNSVNGMILRGWVTLQQQKLLQIDARVEWHQQWHQRTSCCCSSSWEGSKVVVLQKGKLLISCQGADVQQIQPLLLRNKMAAGPPWLEKLHLDGGQEVSVEARWWMVDDVGFYLSGQ